MSKNVVIIGSGNVAEALASALVKSNEWCVQIFGRNRARVDELALKLGVDATTEKERVIEAELYLLALSDSAICEVCQSLKTPQHSVIAHTAGSVSIDEIPSRFTHRGVLYPFQTFTAGREVDFHSVPIVVEGSDRYTEHILLDVANFISGDVRIADSDSRRALHLAGVFACNFTNAMYAVAESLLKDSGFEFDSLKPLILETALKAIESQTPTLVQTGPALRGDLAVENKHLKMLDKHPELQQIYKLISQHIWETSKRISQK